MIGALLNSLLKRKKEGRKMHPLQLNLIVYIFQVIILMDLIDWLIDYTYKGGCGNGSFPQ